MERVYLMILDGFGEGKDYPGNAITHAKMPNLTALREKYPWTTLAASGNAVGLPEGTQGGSEVGHLTIGAGRIVFQYLEKINRTINDGSFFKNEHLLAAMDHVKKNEKETLHLLGMISDQGVHSHLNHLFALLEMAKNNGVETIFIHAITDGRDVPEKSAGEFIEKIQQKIKELKLDAKIATIIGRYYAMDRDSNWDRTAKAYDLYTSGEGVEEKDPLEAIKNAYSRGAETDYYIEPIILDEHGTIKEKDAVIFWNYRTDRTRQITQSFTGEEKLEFEYKKVVQPMFVCFGDYSEVAPVVFPAEKVSNNLGETLEQAGATQLRISETEKYAHVTYFFNSQIEDPQPHEARIMIGSPKVPSYADKPEMSAHEITERVIKELDSQKHDFIAQNFANPDLVGHSGEFAPTVTALEEVDKCIGKIAEACQKNGYHLIITADHGNAENMKYVDNGENCPSHTTNPVIFLLASEKYKSEKLREGGLQDIAPTILKIMNIRQPKEMTGISLF